MLVGIKYAPDLALMIQKTKEKLKKLPFREEAAKTIDPSHLNQSGLSQNGYGHIEGTWKSVLIESDLAYDVLKRRTGADETPRRRSKTVTQKEI